MPYPVFALLFEGKHGRPPTVSECTVGERRSARECLEINRALRCSETAANDTTVDPRDAVLQNMVGLRPVEDRSR